jgi:hypothetical protein
MVHNWDKEFSVRPRTTAIVGEDGVFVSNYVLLKPVRSIQAFPVARLEGARSRAVFTTIVAGLEDSIIDLGTETQLVGDGSRSEAVARTVSRDRSTVYSRGRLVAKTNDCRAHLDCRGIVQSENSTQWAIPDLASEGAPGAELSHEAAISPIAAEEVYYLMSRGVPKDEAVSMITRGFLDVEIPGLPAALRARMTRRSRDEPRVDVAVGLHGTDHPLLPLGGLPIITADVRKLCDSAPRADSRVTYRPDSFERARSWMKRPHGATRQPDGRARPSGCPRARDTVLDHWTAVAEQMSPVDPALWVEYDVKRGLRDQTGRSVLAGLTQIGDVVGAAIEGDQLVPAPGQLFYRGIEVTDLVEGCVADGQHGFEESAYLLLFGALPDRHQLHEFEAYLADMRRMPRSFVHDGILRMPSRDMMNAMMRGVLGLYTLDPQGSDTSTRSVLRQSLHLIAKMPMLAVYGYQAYLDEFHNKSLVIIGPSRVLHRRELLAHAAPRQRVHRARGARSRRDARTACRARRRQQLHIRHPRRVLDRHGHLLVDRRFPRLVEGPAPRRRKPQSRRDV